MCTSPFKLALELWLRLDTDKLSGMTVYLQTAEKSSSSAAYCVHHASLAYI
jgi:hypothetical protein